MAETAIGQAEFQRNVIDNLRFILRAAVVLIHAFHADLEHIEVYSTFKYANCVSFCWIAVRWFFVISGYFFFVRGDFTPKVYVNKLKARVWTLLIPYLFWNGAAILLYGVVLKLLPGGAGTWTLDMNLSSIWGALWGGEVAMGDRATPIVYQMWFIRDLMVIVLLSPLLYWLIKWTRGWAVLALGACWMTGFWLPDWIGNYGLSSTAVFFFALGAVAGIYRKDLIQIAGRMKWVSFILFPLVVVSAVLLRDTEWQPWLRNTAILVGVVFWTNLTAELMRYDLLKIGKWFVRAGFFIYLAHQPWVTPVIGKFTEPLFSFSAAGLCMATYVDTALTMVICLGIYWLMMKWVPKFGNLITGGR